MRSSRRRGSLCRLESRSGRLPKVCRFRARFLAVRTDIRLIVLAAGLVLIPRVAGLSAQSRDGGPQALIDRAAEALGGKERILAIKTLTIEGYGQLAYQNGGGNITSSIDAPQKWIDVNDLVRVIDLEHGRMRVRQRQVNDFVFAAAQNMKGTVSTQVVDGDVAYNIGASGTATRAAA